MLDRAFLFEQRIAEPVACVKLTCAENILLERLSQRPGREDNSPEAIRSRFETWNGPTQDVCRYYADNGKLVSLDASGALEEVNDEFERVILGEVEKMRKDSEQDRREAEKLGRYWDRIRTYHLP
jgi:adenylate kinase family enzyme